MGRKKREEAVDLLDDKKVLGIDELPDFISVEELKQLVQKAEPSTIVDMEDYIYFCIMPTFDKLSFVEIGRTKHLIIYQVLNFKNNTVGYISYFVEEIPSRKNMSEFGVSLFFSKKTQKKYEDLAIPISDAKFRLVIFSDADYFASVKWKSLNPTGELNVD